VTVELPAALEICGLTKRFLGTLALDGVDLSISPGEIQALVGENGAGKSTLIKILAGIHLPDGGEIRLKGAIVHPHLHHLPISFVHQDLGLVDDLSVGENLALVTGFPRRYGLIDWRRVWSAARGIYQVMSIEPPDPRMQVGSLSTAGKAILGIVRALSRQTEIMVLDEPTAALPEPDAAHLFDVLRRLRSQGTSIIYVTHRLNELFGLADRVTVLRDGRRVRSAGITALTPAALVHDMLGRDVEIAHAASSTEDTADPMLEVEELRVEGLGPLSFRIGHGEIVGLIGLPGAGQSLIGRAVFGAISPDAGRIRLAGEPLPTGERVCDRVARGIALLASDRGRESAFSGMSVGENLFPNPVLRGRSPWRAVSPARERREAAQAMERFDVRPRDPTALIDWLSGGNQQKVFVGRWLASGSRLFIMEEPTAGVDVGAKFALHQLLRDAARAGAAIMVVSSDFEEVAGLCDRALVLGRGRITGELRGERLTVANLTARSSLGHERAESVG
jgi:ribose transport system ATP-binding protein